MVLLWPAVEVIRILAQPVHEVVFGDYALFELAARRAWHLDQLLGPDSPVGFYHPGPAMFYLLAPAVRLLEPGPGLYLGALLVNTAALLATIIFVKRQWGLPVALWAAAVLNLFCLAVGLNTLRQPSNPLLLVVPMLLFVMLWAGAMTRVPGATMWAAVIGSFEVQTHITAAPFVTAMLLVAVVWQLAGMARRASPRLPAQWWRRPARFTGIAAFALIWLPGTIELFADNPNNWDLMWRYLHHGHNPGIAVHTSLGIVLRSIAITPFSHRIWTNPLPPSTSEELAGWLIIAAGVALIYWLARRRQWPGVALATASVLAIPLATITVSHAGGDNYAFLTAWTTFVPADLLLALGVGLLTPIRRAPMPPHQTTPATPTSWARNATAWLAIGAMVCAGVAAISDLREPSLRTINRAYARENTFVSDAEAHLKPGDHWVGFLIVSGPDYPLVAGVVLEVQRLGYHTFVDPRFSYAFGRQITNWNHAVQVVFCFYQANDPIAARNTPGTIVTDEGGKVMTAWRPYG